MQTSRRKTGAGLLAIGAFLLFLAACAPHAPAASFAAAAAALRPGTLLWGYQGACSAFTAAWSPDGRALAIGEADGTVQVRDAVTGTLTLSLRGHTQQVWALAWSPDGAHRFWLVGSDRAGVAGGDRAEHPHLSRPPGGHHRLRRVVSRRRTYRFGG